MYLGDEMKNLRENKFFNNFEHSNEYKIPLSGYVLLNYFYKKELVLSNDFNKSFYSTLLKGQDPNKGTGIKKENIKQYFGTVYCDDGDIYSDIENKRPLQELYNILLNNENTNNIGIKTKSAIIHMFNEMDRNVRNHSGYQDLDEKDYIYAIQIYPKRKKLQFVLLDDGKGIHQTMANEKNLDPVLESFKKDNSAKSNHTMTKSSGQNSGYGLYLASELGKKKHELEVIDNFYYYNYNCFKNKYLVFSQKNNYPEKMLKLNEKPFTMVSMIIDIDTISEDIEEISKRANSKSAKSELTILDEDKIQRITGIEKEYILEWEDVEDYWN